LRQPYDFDFSTSWYDLSNLGDRGISFYIFLFEMSNAQKDAHSLHELFLLMMMHDSYSSEVAPGFFYLTKYFDRSKISKPYTDIRCGVGTCSYEVMGVTLVIAFVVGVEIRGLGVI